jgi:hypothetical protein
MPFFVCVTSSSHSFHPTLLWHIPAHLVPLSLLSPRSPWPVTGSHPALSLQLLMCWLHCSDFITLSSPDSPPVLWTPFPLLFSLPPTKFRFYPYLTCYLGNPILASTLSTWSYTLTYVLGYKIKFQPPADVATGPSLWHLAVKMAECSPVFGLW